MSEPSSSTHGPDVIHEIVATIGAMRRAFLRANLKPPKAIELRGHSDGQDLILAIANSVTYSHYGYGFDPLQAKLVVSIKVEGIEIRWPA